MSDNTAIEWTSATWNFLVGCDKVSAGCANCYAIRSVARMSGNPTYGERYQGLVTVGQKPLNWTGKLAFIKPALMKPLGWEQPRRIFVNSLSDLFHPDVPNEWIDQAFAIMAATPHHTYQILTKRPERMAAYVNGWSRDRVGDALVRATEGDLNGKGVDPFWMLQIAWKAWPWPLPNVWLGTSVEDQRAADERIPHLLVTPAAVRFLSCEPLLGPVDLTLDSWLINMKCQHGNLAEEPDSRIDPCGCFPDRPFLDWVITGGESGPKARPMDPAWARSLRDQCRVAGVAYFHKQNGGRTAKANGRLLDGQEYSAFPEPAAIGASS